MLLATIRTDKHSDSCPSKILIRLRHHIFDPLIDEIEIHLMTGI